MNKIKKNYFFLFQWHNFLYTYGLYDPVQTPSFWLTLVLNEDTARFFGRRRSKEGAPTENNKLGWIKDNALKSKESFSPAESSFFENLRMSSLPLSSVITLPLSAEGWAFHIGSGHSVAQSLQSCRGPPVCSDSVSVISSSEQPVWSGKDSPGHWSHSGTLQQPWRCINRLRWWSWVSLTSVE